MAQDPKEPDRIWPGAVEAGLQKLPKVSPIVVDLRTPEDQTWMNKDAAAREKGAPLSTLEASRIEAGRDRQGKLRFKRHPPMRKLPLPKP